MSGHTKKHAALITGGAKRLGRAIAVSLAKHGYDIALHYGRSEKSARETAIEIRRHNQQCELFQCDLSKIDKVNQLMPDVFQSMPHTNLLVNSASIFKRINFMDTDLDVLDRNLNINFKAPFFLTQSFAKLCNNGLIINLLDTKITEEPVNFFAYALSKKLLYSFTRMAAKSLGPDIRVNGICPGIILPSTETAVDVLQKMIRKLPLKRQGDVEKILSAVFFYLENDFVTGECLFIDGGEHLK
jgi:NAD(P)-dependent dehydrogenase (short-subunit alcohol dehydrogenase family)